MSWRIRVFVAVETTDLRRATTSSAFERFGSILRSASSTFSAPERRLFGQRYVGEASQEARLMPRKSFRSRTSSAFRRAGLSKHMSRCFTRPRAERSSPRLPATTPIEARPTGRRPNRARRTAVRQRAQARSPGLARPVDQRLRFAYRFAHGFGPGVVIALAQALQSRTMWALPSVTSRKLDATAANGRARPAPLLVLGIAPSALFVVPSNVTRLEVPSCAWSLTCDRNHLAVSSRRTFALKPRARPMTHHRPAATSCAFLPAQPRCHRRTDRAIAPNRSLSAWRSDPRDELLDIEIDRRRLDALAILHRRDRAIGKRRLRLVPAVFAAVEQGLMFGDHQRALGKIEHRRFSSHGRGRRISGERSGRRRTPRVEPPNRDRRPAATSRHLWPFCPPLALPGATRRLPAMRACSSIRSLEGGLELFELSCPNCRRRSATSARSATISRLSEAINPSTSAGRTIPPLISSRRPPSQKIDPPNTFSTQL